MSELPTGTVTFLFTDLERSTRLWEQHGVAMRDALARHDTLLREAVEAHGGHVVKGTGDGLHAVFPTAGDAAEAAVAGQVALGQHSWGETGPLRVRMALHTGVAEQRGGDYFGPVVNRAARLVAVAHPGQMLCSETTADLVRDVLPNALGLVELGRHQLRDLTRPEAVFQLTSPDVPAEFPPLQSLGSLPGNLPTQVTSFVGRQRELDRIATALRDTPVVTLTGVGGVGKTRLALQIAAEVLPAYRDGAWLCELAGVRDPEAVPDALLTVFGIQSRAGLSATDAFVEFLRGKHLLLVLDNCEHLLRVIASLVGDIGRACPAVRVLATSREGLDVAGEQILVVSSLELPEPTQSLQEIERCEAVELFVDRARAVQADFHLDATNAGAVVQVCRRLDGIALAIELAAARVPMISPTELVRRLDQRFRILGAGSRSAVERHQTLRAAIDWSYDLLSRQERHLLDRLSVFTGGFTLEAAEAVATGDDVEAGEVFELLAALVARHLVVADTTGAETRYALLETIRQYAHEHLEADDDADRRRTTHARYYAELAETSDVEMQGPDGIQWARRLQAEQDNVIGALGWSVETGDLDTALRLLSPSTRPFSTDVSALRPLAERVLAMPDAASHPNVPRAFLAAAVAAHYRDDQQLAARHADNALAAEERLGTGPDARTLMFRALIAQSQRDLHGAVELTERAAALARANGDRSWLALALVNGAITRALLDDSTAVAQAEEALAVASDLDAPLPTAGVLALAGFVLGATDPERGLALVHEAIETVTQAGPRAPGLWTIAGDIAARHHDQRQALDCFAKAIEELHWYAYQPVLGSSLIRVGNLLADTDPEAAAVLLGAGHAIAPEYVMARHVAADHDRAHAAIDHSIGEAARARLNASGAAMSQDEVVNYARHAIARAYARLDSPSKAPTRPRVTDETTRSSPDRT